MEISTKIKNYYDKIRTALITYESLKPIPLTEEILLKFSKKTYESTVWNKYTISDLIRVDFDKELGIYSFTIIGFGFSKEIKYLHQLQNLYFVLIGKELEINLYI